VGASGEVESAENDLARLIGMPVDSVRALHLPQPRTRADELNAADARAAARETNPDIRRARRQLAAAEAGRKEANGMNLPRLQLLGRYAEYMSTATDPQGEWQAGGQLSYSVFGSARGAARDRANADIHAANAEMRMTERRVDEAIDRALAALRAARARVVALEAAVAQSEEVTRIDRLALESGAGVQSEYLTAEADLFRARAALSDARGTELIARTELARVTGRLDEDWITQNVESQQ
jgi:outer membrane protein TolC